MTDIQDVVKEYKKLDKILKSDSKVPKTTDFLYHYLKWIILAYLVVS